MWNWFRSLWLPVAVEPEPRGPQLHQATWSDKGVKEHFRASQTMAEWVCDFNEARERKVANRIAERPMDWRELG